MEALEVGDSPAVPVSKASEGLLIDLLSFLEVTEDEAFSSALTGKGQSVALVNAGLTGSKMRSVGSNVGSSLAVGSLEGSLVDVTSKHGVLDGTVLGGEASNL